jgi:hypothetical protein
MITITATTPVSRPWWAPWRKQTTETVTLARFLLTVGKLGYAFVPDVDLADRTTGPIVEVCDIDGVEWVRVATAAIPRGVIKAGTVVSVVQS